MRKKLFLFTLLFLLIFSVVLVNNTKAESDQDGQLVKMEGLSTLYYVIDGQRYVFPNEKIYKSWFTGFDDVVTLNQEEIYALPLGGNVRYRPGVLLVKITTNPKVYAVAQNGKLRWVKTEKVAKKLYGDEWSSLVDDVPDAFFMDYDIDEPIDEEDDFNADVEAGKSDTIEKNRGLKLGHAKQKQSTTAKCRAIPATPANPNGKGNKATPATRAISARECKVNAGNTDPTDPDETDTTAPIISDISVVSSSTSAIVAWTTDEEATSIVKYSDVSPIIDSTSEIMSDDTLATNHEVELTGLTASTTYYFIVESTDIATNTAISIENTFTTIAE